MENEDISKGYNHSAEETRPAKPKLEGILSGKIQELKERKLVKVSRERDKEEREERIRQAQIPKKIFDKNGFFWDYRGKLFLFNRQYGEDGFTENQAKEIAEKVLDSINKKRLKKKGEDYIRIESSKYEFYVRVNALGEVYLPEHVNSGEKFADKSYIMTSDTKLIKGYAKAMAKESRRQIKN